MTSVQELSQFNLKNPIHLPYSLLKTNNDSSSLLNRRAGIPAVFNELRNNFFLPAPIMYFMGITKFHLKNTSLLPVFIPLIADPASNQNITVYEIVIHDLNSDIYYPATVEWAREDNTYDEPQLSTTGKTIITPYYYAYTYQHVLNLINTAIDTALNDAYSPANNHENPFFSLNKSNFNLQFNYSSQIFTENTDGYELYVNRPLYELLAGFNWTGVADPRGGIFADDELFLLQVETDDHKPYSFRTSQNVDYFTIEQENTSLCNWNPVESIVFTTNSLPIVPTNLSFDEKYASTNPSALIGQSSQGNIISKFSIVIDAQNSYKQELIYTAEAEYRLFSMNSATPLQNLNISVFWSDYNGNLNPYLIPANGSVSVDILFRRSDYNLSTASALKI